MGVQERKLKSTASGRRPRAGSADYGPFSHSSQAQEALEHRRAVRGADPARLARGAQATQAEPKIEALLIRIGCLGYIKYSAIIGATEPV